MPGLSLITCTTYFSSAFPIQLSFLTLCGQVLNCNSYIAVAYVKVVSNYFHRESKSEFCRKKAKSSDEVLRKSKLKNDAVTSTN